MLEFIKTPLSRMFVAAVLMLATAMAFGLVPLGTQPTIAQAQQPTTPLVVETDKGKFTFQIELANTPEMRSRGLMFRAEMAADRGMLFEFDSSRPVMMWMKNTILSLDMVFIEEGGKIARITRDTTPFSLETISSGGPVRFVLELNAGTAVRTGLEKGQILQHKIFGNGGS